MSTATRIYAFRFAQDFRPIYPLYALLFEDSGLSNAQISLLFAAWAAISLAAEIPAGAIGDKFDRRKVVAFGNFLCVPAFALWFIEPSFWSFLAGFALWGIGEALESGTYEALVYDELKNNDDEQAYTKITGRAEAFALTGILLATLLAAVIANDSYSAVLAVSIVTTLVASAIAINFPKARPLDETSETEILDVFKAGWKEVRQSRALLAAMALSVLTASAYGDLEEYDGLFVSDVGVERNGVALVLAAFTIITAAGAMFAHRIDNAKQWAVPALLIVSGGFLMSASLMQNRLAIVPLAFFFLLIKGAEVVAGARLQHAIKGEARATITSVAGFATGVVSIFVYGLFALAGDRFLAFSLVAAILIAAGLIALGKPSRN